MNTVIVDEVVASVSLMDHQALLDQRTLSRIVGAVMSAMEEKTARERRRAEETRIGDDGRRGIAHAGG